MCFSKHENSGSGLKASLWTHIELVGGLALFPAACGTLEEYSSQALVFFTPNLDSSETFLPQEVLQSLWWYTPVMQCISQSTHDPINEAHSPEAVLEQGLSSWDNGVGALKAVTVTPSPTLMHFVLEPRQGSTPSGWAPAVPQLSRVGSMSQLWFPCLSPPSCAGGCWVLLFSSKQTHTALFRASGFRKVCSYQRNQNNRNVLLFLPARCQTHYLKASNTSFLSTIFIFPSQVRK